MIDKLINIAIIGVVGVGGYMFINAKMKQANLEKTEGVLGESVDAQQAVLLRTAINPSGIPWLLGVDGKNANTLLKVARQIKDFKKVAEAYRNLYKEDLSNNLTNEFKGKELDAFFAIVNANRIGAYLVGEKIPIVNGSVNAFKNAAPSTVNFAGKIKAPFVIMTKVVTKVPYNIGNKRGQWIMNLVELPDGRKFYVKNTELLKKK